MINELFGVYPYEDLVAVPLKDITSHIAVVYLPKNLNKPNMTKAYLYNKSNTKGNKYVLVCGSTIKIKKRKSFVITHKDNVKKLNKFFVVVKDNDTYALAKGICV